MTGRDRHRFGRDVGDRADRKRRARERGADVWFGLGMFGLVGWSIVLPTLVGIAVGAGFDSRNGTQGVSWTLTGLGAGLTLGCLLAWWWVRQESRGADDEPEERVR